VHRDIKPQNVLLNERYEVVISDFGLCKDLIENQSSFQTTHAGTVGWTAPEALRNGRTTRAVDVFGAGCVIHYVHHSTHPYGPYFERESNIRKAKRKLTRSENKLLDDLLLKMLESSAEKRITAEAALYHPYFWSNTQLLGLFMDVSDRVEKEKADSPLVLALEDNAQHVVGVDWRQNIGDQLLADLNRFRRYNWSSVVDLLRAARNKKHHYMELPEELKEALGSLPDGFLTYFTKRFPRLAPHLYNKVASTPMREEAIFAPYFGGSAAGH